MFPWTSGILGYCCFPFLFAPATFTRRPKTYKIEQRVDGPLCTQNTWGGPYARAMWKAIEKRAQVVHVGIEQLANKRETKLERRSCLTYATRPHVLCCRRCTRKLFSNQQRSMWLFPAGTLASGRCACVVSIHVLTFHAGDRDIY